MIDWALEDAERLMAFIDASPTPYHAVDTATRLLESVGSIGLDPAESWGPEAAGPAHVVRDGSLVAWSAPRGGAGPSRPLRLIGAHTDSPNLRIRPRPDVGLAGWRQLRVEVYGGALLNSWLDRDLELAGRVVVADRDGRGGVDHRLFRSGAPLMRVPQLAIHLDRSANEGLALDRQRHMTPVWGLGEAREGNLREWLAAQVGVEPAAVLAWDAMAADSQPAAILGADRNLLAAGRLDNLFSCWAALEALGEVIESETEPPTVARSLHYDEDRVAPAAASVVVLYDHEEVGSTTATGAAGAWLAQVLERRVLAMGGDRQDLLRSMSRSMMLSTDMAHATHPNHPERHEPGHWVTAGAGPVIKHNVNARYATDSRGAAAFRLACEQAGVPVQDYSHRGDLPCGSTIGPLAAAGLAVDTVDVGAPQLSMHSARELMACADVELFRRALGAWFTSA